MNARDGEPSKEKGSSIGPGILSLFFGIYLFVGAFEAFRTAKWPIFMPPQLDLVAGLLSVFGAPAGAYLAGGFVAILGGLFVWLSAVLIAKGGHA